MIKIILTMILFIFPGIIFVKKTTIDEIIKSITISLSFWIISFWLGINQILLFSVTLFGSLFYLIKKRNIKLKTPNLVVSSIFIVILVLRILPFVLNYFPAGADMSFHTLTTQVIIDNQEFPETYEPYLPIKYGGYPVGFHILSSYISLLTKLPAYKSTLLIANFSYAFLTFAFYLFLRNYFDKKSSLIGSVAVSFIANNPQFFISWGGNPFVLSLGFLVIAASYFERFFKLSKLELVITGLISVTSFLIHPMPVLGFFYMYLPVFLFKLYKHKTKKSVNKILILVLTLIILIVPFVLRFNFNISQSEIDATNQRNQDKYLSWKGNLQDSLVSIPKFSITLFGKNFMNFAFISLLFLFLSKKHRLSVITLTISLFLLILNSKYQILPLSYLLFSERIGILFLLPCAIAISYLSSKFLDTKFLKSVLKIPIIVKSASFIFIFFILYFSVFNYLHYLRVSDMFSMVTKEDLEAFEWIKENTDENSAFINNRGDAGLWILPLTGRNTREIQIVQIYYDEVHSYLDALTYNYVYFGNKKVYETHLNLIDYQTSENYELSYTKSALIFENTYKS